MTSGKWYPFRFDLYQPSIQITASGTKLELVPQQEGGHPIHAQFSLAKIGEIVEYGEILELKLRIPDEDGNVWETSSQFPSAVFVKYLGDLTYEPSWPRYFDPENNQMAEAFSSNLILNRLNYFNDGRYVRNIAVENTILGIYFKYTVILMDVGMNTSAPDAIAVRASSIGGQALHDDGGATHEIYFQIPIMYLLHHNSMGSVSQEPLRENDIPNPLIFRKTELSVKPQTGVRELA